MRSAALSLAVLACAFLLAAPAAQAAEAEAARTITVLGEGLVAVKPDTATVSAGVATQESTAREALTANTARMTAVMAALAAAGIAAEDIRTSGFSVTPVYAQPEPQPDGRRPVPEIAGYSASNQVLVTVRDLDDMGAVLDEVVSAGANTVNGVSFYLDDMGAPMDEARSRAVQDALRRATVLARAANANLGAVVSISEQGGYRPEPMRMSASAATGMDVPVAPGMQDLRATVVLVIGLE